MEPCFLARLVVGFAMVVISTADPQTQFQFRRPALNPVNGQIRNFVLNRIGGVRGGHYPPVPPDSRREQLPGDSRNFIPNRFDIPASVVDRKQGPPKGCIGTQDICGSFAPAPAPAPALPMAPAYPSPGAYTGYPPQNAFPGMPPDPYNPQGYPASPNIPPNMKALAQNTGAAVAAKAKLLGGLNPLKKFVPHLPPLGRPQKGRPPYNPPPPQPEPPVAGYGQGTSQMPYQQPLSYNPQGMVPPQSTGYGSPPTAGFAPPAFAAPQAPAPFAPQQPQSAFNQAPFPIGAPQQDQPQLALNDNAPQAPPPQPSFSPEMSQGPLYPGQQASPDGSFDIARKRMMALKMKGLAKRFGVPRPVVRSRLVPRPLYKRHS